MLSLLVFSYSTVGPFRPPLKKHDLRTTERETRRASPVAADFLFRKCKRKKKTTENPFFLSLQRRQKRQWEETSVYNEIN